MFAIKNILLKLLGSNVGKNWLKITTGNGKILIASPLCAIPANILHIPMVRMQGTSKIFPILHSAILHYPYMSSTFFSFTVIITAYSNPINAASIPF